MLLKRAPDFASHVVQAIHTIGSFYCDFDSWPPPELTAAVLGQGPQGHDARRYIEYQWPKEANIRVVVLAIDIWARVPKREAPGPGPTSSRTAPNCNSYLDLFSGLALESSFLPVDALPFSRPWDSGEPRNSQAGRIRAEEP